MNENNAREGINCVLGALFLGIVFDRLFFDKAFGISFFIYMGLCIIFFLWTNKGKIKVERNLGWFLLIPIGLLSINYSVYTNGILWALNVLVVSLLMIVSSIIIINPNVKWDRLSFIFIIFKQAIVNVLVSIGEPFKVMAKLIQWKDKSEAGRGKRQVLVGLLISIPLLAVILALLNSADMVFSYYISNITFVFHDIDTDLIIPHGIAIIFPALYLLGFAWSYKSNKRREDKNIEIKTLQWEPITIMTVIVILNILYLFFTVVQFSYLYGGGTMTLPAGFTYAEYARRGFFELAAVTFLNFIIVISCVKFMKKENKKLTIASNVLFSILIFFTLNMLYSANLKLSLYEGTYGYTYLRVFVHLFMLLLFILCLIALAGIWYRKVSIIKSIILISIAMYTIVNYLNVDGFIARKNVELYFQTGKIDAKYLCTLSYEAVPYMLELKDVQDNQVRDIVNKNLENKKEALAREKYWSEFNFSKDKARKLLGIK